VIFLADDDALSSAAQDASILDLVELEIGYTTLREESDGRSAVPAIEQRAAGRTLLSAAG
jgi:hypothetical protein